MHQREISKPRTKKGAMTLLNIKETPHNDVAPGDIDNANVELSHLQEGDLINITLEAVVGDVLFDNAVMENVGALVYLKLSHSSLWINPEDMENITITRR